LIAWLGSNGKSNIIETFDPKVLELGYEVLGGMLGSLFVLFFFMSFKK
jgi:uncharacterized membrane protein